MADKEYGGSRPDDGGSVKLICEDCRVTPALCVEMVNQCRYLSVCERTPLGCGFFLSRMVLNMVREIGMTPLKHMHVELVDFHNPKLRGASAVALIAESHVAMHSWSEFNAVRVVIDSCKAFDIDRVTRWLGNSLAPSQIAVSTEGEKRYVRPDPK